MNLREGSKVMEHGIVYLVEELLPESVTLLRLDRGCHSDYEYKRELSRERVSREFEMVSP